MAGCPIGPFLCGTIDKALVRGEWEKWLRSVQLYLEAEDITSYPKQRSKLLHLGGPELQTVAYNLPGALEEYNSEINNDVYKTLVAKLTDYFSPTQNSTFERHVFRKLRPKEGENFNAFLLQLRSQAARCSFGATAQEATEINIKDKIVDAWAPNDLKLKLLEKERSLDEVIQLCQIQEQITDQSQTMSTTEDQPSTSLGLDKVLAENLYCYRLLSTQPSIYGSAMPAPARRMTKMRRDRPFCRTLPYPTRK